MNGRVNNFLSNVTALAVVLVAAGFSFPAKVSAAPISGNGLAAVYFDNNDFSDPALVRIDPTVNFGWGTNSPNPSISGDWFSVRWTGMVRPKYDETYTFYVDADDGVRLWVNNQLLIDSWQQQNTTEHSASIALEAHQFYALTLEYFHSTGNAEVHLSWSSDSTPKEIIPGNRLFSGDALHNRVRSGLRTFNNWLAANGERGFIGEAGWPDDINGEALKWNALADAWLIDADAAKLPFTEWATGEWYSGTYFSMYEKTSGSQSLNTTNTQAAILEAHPTTPNYLRGINNPGGEYGGPNTDATSDFSNHNIGIYNTTYHFDSQATFDYFASRSNALVRIPFRWERIQRNLGQALDATELQRLQDAVTRARNAGLKVIIDMHNYGAYYPYDSSQNKGVRRAIGSTQVTTNDFADVWRRLSAVFKSDDSVFYGLMNEPVNMGSVDAWKNASQAALTAIRNNGDNKLVLVGGYNWSGVTQFPVQHSTGWIDDPENNFQYEAHHYWDSDGSGGYANSYSTEVYFAETQGFGCASRIAEAETLSATTSAGITHAAFSDNNLSEGAGDKLNATAANQFITYEVEVPAAGSYTIRVGVKKQDSRGIFQLAIGGANQSGVQDNFSPVDYSVELNLGSKTFNTAGTKQFKFAVTGKNSASSGYTLGIDYIKLTPAFLKADYEMELGKILDSSGDTIQPITESELSRGMGDKLNSNAAGDFVTYAVDVPEARSYKVFVRVKKQDSRGIFQLSIGGANQGAPQDNYTPTNSFETLDLGTKTFGSKGTKQFKFIVTGKNESSLGYSLLLDYIRLVPE